ncbi:response regulator transcription factor [Actinoplanes sp. NPDC051475]|uniref:response regulator transcription factor n=1 Tax=Actinoplanes sp. NPDC051475 TaxID=3157225 RepID=UPI00344E1C5E
MKVLLVEDDQSIAEPLVDGLARYGIVADHVATGAAALAAAPTDMVLLDAAVRDIDGIEICRRLSHTGETPLIVLTARGERTDTAPDLGADDYLPKPFSVPELVACMRAVSRRRRAVPVRICGPLSIDTRTHEVRVHRIPVSLSPKEYDLLTLLAQDPGAVVSRRHILESVWGPAFPGPGKTLDFHVASLRRKLGDPGWIENRRGVGFRLALPV